MPRLAERKRRNPAPVTRNYTCSSTCSRSRFGHHRGVLVSGQWALVTGASSGLGEQFARQLAGRGLSLVLSARSAGPLEEIAARLSSEHGVGTRIVTADLATPQGADALIAGVEKLAVPIEHVIGNAGYGSHGLFAELDGARERAMVRLNCESIVAIAHAFLPAMIERKRGGVLHVASTAAFQPAAHFATYAATKAFVLSFTEALHEELRPSGVHAMVLCPGPVPTNFQKRAGVKNEGIARLMILSAHDTVERALAAYERGCAVYVPGMLNKTGAFVAQVAPRSMVRRVAAVAMRDAGDH
jgi:short-subunit dehydrogenase